MIVSNTGVVPDFSALSTDNAGSYMATIQVQLNQSHKTSSFEYMDRLHRKMSELYPALRTFFSSGFMVDAVLNMGMPAPIDVQVSAGELRQACDVAQSLAARIRRSPKRSISHRMSITLLCV